jgi:hypothetical protein
MGYDDECIEVNVQGDSRWRRLRRDHTARLQPLQVEASEGSDRLHFLAGQRA